MKLQMNKNSIFAVLLRSPWWISAGLAAGLFALARALLPAEFALYAIFFSLPFAVVAGYAAWQQLRAPSEAAVSEAMEVLRGLSWNEFSAAIEEAFRREGHTVFPCGAVGADFELAKAGRVCLVGCKRWKVARTGVEPLRELDSARLARDAHESLYIAAGEITETARAFAAEKGIRLLDGVELVRLLPKLKRLHKT